MTTKRKLKLNLVNLSKSDYRGAPTTLCKGCGHNSITSQIISACYEMNVKPEEIVKLSGIGCSSKAPTYFLSRSFGFNGLHGRMPSLATGALFADTSMTGIGMSGDGDTASIGMGQFIHVMRRNLPLVYIVANNGVYGLTKGQFSATAEEGLALKKLGTNPFMPVDIVWEAVVNNASFVARSFAGDPKQVKELLKAAIAHKGIAVLDIISPCVTFNNRDDSRHSYAWGKEHEVALHELSYVPMAEEIMVDYEEGETKDVTLHDGSRLVLRKVGREYDPTERAEILCKLEDANRNQELLTGLIYINPDQLTIFDMKNLPDKALNRLTAEEIRPKAEALDKINALMF